MWFSPLCHWTRWEKSQRNELVPHQEAVFSGEYIWGEFPIQQGIQVGRGFLSKSHYNGANQLQVTHSADHLLQVGCVCFICSLKMSRWYLSLFKKVAKKRVLKISKRAVVPQRPLLAASKDYINLDQTVMQSNILVLHCYITFKTIICLLGQYATFSPIHSNPQ